MWDGGENFFCGDGRENYDVKGFQIIISCSHIITRIVHEIINTMSCQMSNKEDFDEGIMDIFLHLPNVIM
jgi:hypothetical protein